MNKVMYRRIGLQAARDFSCNSSDFVGADTDNQPPHSKHEVSTADPPTP